MNDQTIDIEELYAKYGPMVLRRCRSILKDEDAALDAMQEVFVKLITNKDSLSANYPSSLLFRMATNICLNVIRDSRSTPTSPDDLVIAGIADYDDAHERFVISDYLGFLFKDEPESTREIAYMHYVDGMTYEDVADEVGMSVSGVRKRLRVFKEKARSVMGEEL